MSDTPRTDAMDNLRYMSDNLFELSRQLERELAEANAHAARLQDRLAEVQAEKSDSLISAVEELSVSQQEVARLREALDGIMALAKVAYCETTDPIMTDALVGIGKRCKDAIDAELARKK